VRLARNDGRCYLQDDGNILRGPWGVVPIDTRGPGGDGVPPDMGEGLGRLEGAREGLRHSQNLVIGAAFLVALILVGLGIYELQRIDQLSDRIDQLSDRIGQVSTRVTNLPGQISGDLRDLTKTLAESITAAKQTPPQVIRVPAPARAPTLTPTIPPAPVPAPAPITPPGKTTSR
jgi:outer membrane murein-binding lipoprotein Lpp